MRRGREHDPHVRLDLDEEAELRGGGEGVLPLGVRGGEEKHLGGEKAIGAHEFGGVGEGALRMRARRRSNGEALGGEGAVGVEVDEQVVEGLTFHRRGVGGARDEPEAGSGAMERGEGGQRGDGEEMAGDGGEEGREELAEEEDGGLELVGKGGGEGTVSNGRAEEARRTRLAQRTASEREEEEATPPISTKTQSWREASSVERAGDSGKSGRSAVMSCE